MRRLLFLVLIALPLLAQKPTVQDAKAFMDKAEPELLKLGIDGQRTEWVLENFINDDTEQIAAQSNERLIARTTELVLEARKFDGLQLPPDLARKFLLLKLSLGMPAPNDARLREELTQVAA